MLTNQLNEKLKALLVAYTKKLPGKIENIEQQWTSLLKRWDPIKFQTFHREVHSLCGSAGTYGYTSLGSSARQLEIYLKSLLESSSLSKKQQQHVSILLEQLKETFKQAVPETISVTGHSSEHKKNNLIYIFDQDKNFIADIEKNIKESGYIPYAIFDVSSLMREIEINPPAAVIVDIESLNDKNLHYWNEMYKEKFISFPLFCTAVNGDIFTRLKAVNVGGKVFLQKPVDPLYLTKTLDQFCGATVNEPYRILIIDDTQSIAEYFTLILQEAGMITHYITNPLLVIKAFEEFQPDLLLMDIYMPECTGLELAAVLRQDVQFTKIPIIFLSTEDDRLKQLSALNLGGDDFLTKPILPQHLVEAVKSRAKRAGILSSFMMRDSLTGLLNHTTILERLDIELARAQRQSEAISFVMIDIDHFKNVNDTYGHPIGDQVLRSLSSLLFSSLRKTDVVGRYGGEEFAIIFPNTDKDLSLKICDHLREKFSQIPYKFNDTEFYVTFSAGISSFPQVQDAKSLVICADKALYVAKQNGRNQVHYHLNVK